uniref:Phosphodiesterase n=1 Tax=Amphora coffeiformis TaxID=265554 RepID=A0A7S3P6B8_9STRA
MSMVPVRRNSLLNEGAPRRNSLLNDIKEEQSIEFNSDLNHEFQDSDDESSISLGLDDAMVGDDELRRGPGSDNESVEECMDEEEGQTKKDKSITQRVQKRTKRAKSITWGLFLLLGVATVIGSYFITRHEDCEGQREQYAWLAESLQQGSLKGFGTREHALKALANLAVSDQWPYHIVLGFEEQAKDILSTGNFETVYLAPLVQDQISWEQYQSSVAMGPADDRQMQRGYDTVATSSTASLPLWHIASAANTDGHSSVGINFNLLSLTIIQEAVDALKTTEFYFGELPTELLPEGWTSAAFLMQPFRMDYSADSAVAGYALAVVSWERAFAEILPPGSEPMLVKIESTINAEIAVRNIQVMGPEASLMTLSVSETPGRCFEYVCFHQYWHHMCIEPAESARSTGSFLYVGVAVIAASVMWVLFCVYDTLLFCAQRELIQAADQSLAVVSSLFPKNFQDRLLEKEKTKIKTEKGTDDNMKNTSARELLEGSSHSIFNPKRGLTRVKSSLTNFLHENSEHSESAGLDFLSKTKPIADLFPETTIMFGDLVGFTAWSSAREPTSVFRLLETIYYHFDELAKQRKVFKVETVGDCYVAVSGLPQPRKDHAMVMCRFARDCLLTFNRVVKQLEVELGPDTGDLGLRVGLHSGQTTAGVLRGDRARFQLFGDTVNVTSRMESTGKAGKIQVSQSTADLLNTAGKGHWIRPREEAVVAKGKGEMKTFWLEVYSGGAQGTGGMYSETEWTEAAGDSGINVQDLDGALTRSLSQQMLQATDTHISEAERHTRLVEWNADLLLRLLKAIIARRYARRRIPDDWEEIKTLEDSYKEREALVMEEVVEVIELPSYSRVGGDPESVEMSPVVEQQLKSFVETISFMYRDNPFHNFEHASHVCMSVNKLLSRITAPDLQLNGSGDLEHELHDHTYGITSDPLTQFACVLCALIHDVDHTGLPNSVLVKEETPLAKAYNNRSVAEQNSIDLAWDALMGIQYTELRQAIYQTKEEFQRFRQLLVNAVLATDIMDKELKSLRNSRWEKTFADKSQHSEADNDDVNRKATIVIEHIIQASDVAHTMQHWQIYRKWNERLYEELYNAYKEGRCETDPTDNWYKGEIGFLDFYVIPLAKKLKECGVFGVSSDEYLNYALQNREEWVAKGQGVIEEMRQKMDGNKGRKGQSLKTMSLLTNPNSAGGNASFSSIGNLSMTQLSFDCPITPAANRRHLTSGGSSSRSLSMPGDYPSSPCRDVAQKGNGHRSMSMPSGATTPTSPVSSRGLSKSADSSQSLSKSGDRTLSSTPSRRSLLKSTHSDRSINRHSNRTLTKPKSRRDLLNRSDSNRSANMHSGTLSSTSSRRNLLKSTHSNGSLGVGSLHGETSGHGILKHSRHSDLKDNGCGLKKSPSSSTGDQDPPPEASLRDRLKANMQDPPLNSGKTAGPARRGMMKKGKSSTMTLGDSVASFF